MAMMQNALFVFLSGTGMRVKMAVAILLRAGVLKTLKMRAVYFQRW